MKAPHLLALVSIFTSILLTSTHTEAQKLDLDETKKQQRQLESLLNEIEQTSQQRQKHDQRIIRLKHQLECNWMLIRAYEKCGSKHGNSPDEHLNCSTLAKQNALTCINPNQAK